jgi:ankyrin repeat protein
MVSVCIDALFDDLERHTSIFLDACENGDVDIVDILLQLDLLDPSVNNSAIREASKNGHIDVVDRLLQGDRSRVDPTFDNIVAFRLACQNGHIEVVDRLLQNNMVHDIQEAMYQASYYKQIDVMDRLLRNGADPSVKNNIILYMAWRLNHIDVIDRLLQDDRIDPTTNNNELLCGSVGYGNNDIVYLLLKDGRVDPMVGIYSAFVTNCNDLVNTEMIDTVAIDIIFQESTIDIDAVKQEIQMYSKRYVRFTKYVRQKIQEYCVKLDTR